MNERKIVETRKPNLRRFGLETALALAVLGAGASFFGKIPPSFALMGLALLFFLLGLLIPGILLPAYHGLTWTGRILGWVNTRLFLGVLYYILMTPFGIIRRLFGKNPIRSDFYSDAPIGWKRCPARKDPERDLERQF